jgi:hypothetical protein
MSDTLEKRLRESMERGAGGMSVEPRAPERVLRRARRRQTGTILVATAVAVVVAIGSFAAVKLYWPSAGGPATEGDVTSSTVGGVTITYPADWQFESGRDPELALAGADQLPIFALDNEPPAVPIFSGQGNQLCTGTSVILGVLEQHGISPSSGAPPEWPVDLRREQAKEADGCGEFWSAEWGIEGRSFVGFLRMGAAAPQADRVAAFDAFGGMTFGPDPSPPSIPPTAGSVSGGAWVSQSGPGGGSLDGPTLATGTANGERWRLVAGQDHGDIALEVQYAGGASGIGGFTLPEQGAIELTSADMAPTKQGVQDGELVVFGAASKDVARIEESGTGTRAQIVAMPSSLGATFNAFVLVTSANQPHEIVAYDAHGNELDRQGVEGGSAGPGAPTASGAEAVPSPSA